VAQSASDSQNVIPLYFKPTLVVGLGGTGAQVVRELAERLIWRYGSLGEAPHIQFMVIDTAEKDIKSFVEALPELRNQCYTLSPDTQEFARASENLRYCEVIGLPEWGDARMFRHVQGVAEGAGGIRMLGRWAFLWSPQFANILSTAKDAIAALRGLTRDRFEELDRVRTLRTRGLVPAPQLAGQPRVWVIASAGGGTGAGSFIDFGFLLRRIAREIGGGFNTQGMLAVAAQQVVDDQKVLANTAAILDELDYAQSVKFARVRHRDQKSFEVLQPPFDRVFAVSPATMDGQRLGESGKESYDLLCRRVAAYMYVSIDSMETTEVEARITDFGPAMSAPDGDGRMPFLYTLGLKTIEYPADGVHRAVTSRVMHRLLTEWTKPRTLADLYREDQNVLMQHLGLGGGMPYFLGEEGRLTRIEPDDQFEPQFASINDAAHRATGLEEAITIEVGSGIDSFRTDERGAVIQRLLEAEGNVMAWFDAAAADRRPGQRPAVDRTSGWIRDFLIRKQKRCQAACEAQLLQFLEDAFWDFHRGPGYVLALLEWAKSEAQAYVQAHLRRAIDAPLPAPNDEMHVRRAFEAREDGITRALLCFTGSAGRILDGEARRAQAELERYFQGRLSQLAAQTKLSLLEALVTGSPGVALPFLDRLARRLTNFRDFMTGFLRRHDERAASITSPAYQRLTRDLGVQVADEEIAELADRCLGGKEGLAPEDELRYRESLFANLARAHLGAGSDGSQPSLRRQLFVQDLAREGESVFDPSMYQGSLLELPQYYGGFEQGVRLLFVGHHEPPVAEDLRGRLPMAQLVERLNVYSVSALDKFEAQARRQQRDWQQYLRDEIMRSTPMLPLDLNRESYRCVGRRPRRAGFWGICPNSDRLDQIRDLMRQVMADPAFSGIATACDQQYFPVVSPTSEFDRYRISFVVIHGAVTTDIIYGYSVSDGERRQKVQVEPSPYAHVLPERLPPRDLMRRAEEAYLLGRIIGVLRGEGARNQGVFPGTQTRPPTRVDLHRDLMIGSVDLIRRAEGRGLECLEEAVLARIEELGPDSDALAEVLFRSFGQWEGVDATPEELVRSLGIDRVRAALDAEVAGEDDADLEVQAVRYVVLRFLERRNLLSDRVQAMSRPATANVREEQVDGATQWVCDTCGAPYHRRRPVYGDVCGNCNVMFH